LALLLLAAAPVQAGTLDRVRDTGTLRLGHRIDVRPFSYRGQGGKAAGYSVELCQRVAEAVKVEVGAANLAVEYVEVGTEDRFDAVEQGKIDLLCGAATATLERRKRVAFSIPIFLGGIGALLRADSPARLQAVLEGREAPFTPRWRASLGQVLEKRVLSAEAGTTAESWLAQRREALDVNAEIVLVKSYQEGVDRVLARRSDVLFGDRAILLETAARSEAADDLVVLSRQYTYEPIALVSARTDEDFRLLVDRTLSRLYRSGEIESIYESFFGKPDPNALAFFRYVSLPE
jgi:polar amino acid transport system substrate-binding protein